MSELNKADFQQWKDNPITKMMLEKMQQELSKQDSLSQIQQGPNWTLGESLSFQLGKVQGMRELLSLDSLMKGVLHD